MINERLRLRFVAPLRPKTPPSGLDGEVAFLPMEAIGEDGSYDHSSKRPAAEVASSGYTYFKEGDVVRARVTPCFENGKGALLSSLAGGRGVGTTELFVFEPSPRIDPRFLYYVTISRDFTEQGTATMYGAHGVRRVDDQFVRDYRVWVPPVSTQRAIAVHLDRETARIDALIASKRRIVELLGERWQTVIHDAAAGRLGDHQASRRASGLAWLEDVPAHWEEGQLKLVAKLGSGHTPSRSHPNWWANPTIPWITTGEVAQMRSDKIELITETRERISEIGMANSAAELHPAGTVVLCRTAASAGYSAIMGRDMATSQDFATWTCGPRLNPRFLLLCLRAMRQDLLGRLAMGSTHKTIYMPDIESIAVPLPPPSEQLELVEAANVQQGNLDACVTRICRQIDLLEDRRQAVISAAVTGQLDVPEAA